VKTYYLKLTQRDFTEDSGTWYSDTLDLYAPTYLNEDFDAEYSYKNYSTVKSLGYGLDDLGTTWIGNSWIDTGVETDLGIIDDDRFLDRSGRIDVVDWTFSYSGNPGEGAVVPALDYYGYGFDNDPDGSNFPDEWSYRQGEFNVPAFNVIAADRWARLGLRLFTDQDTSSLEFEIIVRVRIGRPLQGLPLFAQIKTMQRQFPEWMALTEWEREDESLQLATPNSLGGKLFAAVSGQWLEDLRQDLNYYGDQQFLVTADTTQLAWCYRAADIPDQYIAVVGDGVLLSQCVDLEDFYQLREDEDGYWVNKEDNTIFVTKNYESFVINGQEYELNAHHIWNWFDEFGAIMDIQRLYLEDNLNYKQRLLDTYINKPGVGVDNFKLALRRELDLWKYDDSWTDFATPATPNSYWAGATPTVYEIHDLETHDDFMAPDGIPTEKFESLVEELARKYPSTWGYAAWNKAGYDAGGEKGEGYSSLSKRYDATPVSDDETQSGVGDGNDLYLYRPDEVTGPREFNVYLKLRGKHKTFRNEYRKVDFKVEVWGQGSKTVYDNPLVTDWFTIRVVLNADATPGANQTYYHSFQISSKSDVSATVASPTSKSWGKYNFMTAAGVAQTDSVWTRSDGVAFTVDGTSFEFTWDDISTATLFPGKWDYNGGSPTYTNVPANNYRAFWGADTTSYIEQTGPASVAATGTPITVSMYSKSTSSSTQTWESVHGTYDISLNGALPGETTQSFTLSTPNIVWDPAVGTRYYGVKFLTTQDGDQNFQEVSPTYGGFFLDTDGVRDFLPSTYIYLNGSNTWTSGAQTLLASTTTGFVFSTGGSPSNYPVNAPYWELFEATQTTPQEGVVDENGPWRNGIAPQPGNTNFNLVTVEVARSDFGVADDDDYVVTWIGVESDNPRVLTWIDSNSVKPAVPLSTLMQAAIDATYPVNAVVEEENAGVYSYEPIIIRAKMNPNISPEWNPQIHSGWFYDRQDEYYLYANPYTESATATTAERILGSVARMGAPIIVRTDESTPQEFRQIAIWDDATPGYTMTLTQRVKGSGTENLYLAYNDIYDVVVTNTDSGAVVPAETYSSTNVIGTSVITDRDIDYEVAYKINRSFFADHDYVDPVTHTQKTKLVFDSPLDTGVSIDYERSKFDPATPVDLPLNTFYTVQDEGFVFLSHNEYDLAKVDIRLSPSTIMADGQDFMLITIRSLDRYGNPKPFATVNLSSTFGTLDVSTITTDQDGFGVAKLTSASGSSGLTGTITVSGDVSATVGFNIANPKSAGHRLIAMTSAEQIPADGTSSVYVQGKVQDENYLPVPSAIVYWRKGRYMHDVWVEGYDTSLSTPGRDDLAGRVIANENGIFQIGPFVAATPMSPGYWFVVVESESASPTLYSSTPHTYGATPGWTLVGDAVFWLEHPDGTYGVEDLNGLPRGAVQFVENPDTIPNMVPPGVYAWPANYDPATPDAPATPVTLTWESSQWYAIDRYEQYQMGLIGTPGPTQRRPLTQADLDSAHPDYREF